MAVTVIDLDLAPPPAAESWRPSRRVRRVLRSIRRQVRPILAAAFVAAAAMTLGAASTAAPGPTRVLSVAGPEVRESLLTRSVFYTAEAGETPGPGSTIRARPLVAGAPDWTAMVPQSGDQLSLSLVGGVLIVGTAGPSPVTFLDAATGAKRWQIEQDAEIFPGADAVLVRTPGLDEGPDEAPDRLWLADLRSGRTIWSRPVGRPVAVDVDRTATGSLGHVLTVDRGGRATIYRFADGRVLASGALGVEPERWDGADPDRVAMVSVLGGRLYVLSADGDRGTVTAYRLDTLARLWSAGPVPRGRARGCAGMLCVAGDAGVAALNPGNGSIRWTDRRWYTATASVEGLILGADAEETRMALLDPATGRVARSPGNGVVRAGLLLRSDSRAADRMWITDLVTGDVLGRLDGIIAPGCAVAAAYLSCPTSHNTFDVWRLV